ncbi:MAG TPA: phosphoribosylanthranilate isomerase [Pirellulales bacterium]|jgi:phosphoribosylanthranilate isomerase|nr:phosphoribosylanthranilate isomerase [Pirellulales bacterium]
MNAATKRSLFRIKICGVTNVADALAAAEAGADAIGLNFYAQSRRYVSPAEAAKIVAALPPAVSKIGVFVNSPVEEVRAIRESLGLDAVQLHGDETAHHLAALIDVPTIKALRYGPGGLMMVYAQLMAYSQVQAAPIAVLLDAYQPGEYGGTGQTFDWDHAAKYQLGARQPPLILAGGLTAENVAEAIARVGPAAVDTASGVESSPGHKDADKMRRFVTAAREAFDRFHG